MDRGLFLRRCLWATFASILAGAYVLASPESELVRIAGLPAKVSLHCRMQLAMLVAVFGGAYAWLARRPWIDRSLIGFAAIARSCFLWSHL